MKPFLVTEPQAGRVPLWGLLFLALLYALPGLLGRDPWRGDDALGFGVAYNMLLALQVGDFNGWLISQLPGVLLPDEGPFPFWIVSLVGLLTESLGIDFSLTTRLIWVASWLATLALCWRAVYRLSQRPEWIPHDPIGIAASPRRLAASLADSSVLFLLATVGLIERVHETSPEAFAMLIMAGAFFCLAWSLDSPRQASWLLGFIVSAAWLCKGMWFGLGLGLAILILVKLSPHWRSIAPVMLPRASLVVVLVLLLWFWLMYRDPVSAASADDEAAHATRLNWMAAWWTLQLGGPLKGFATRIFDLLREPWWFFWPVWPVAIWAVWSLRDRIREPSLIAPISLIAAMVLFSPVAHGSSLAWFMPIAVPLAALAALGLPSLRRGLVQFVDWYAVLVYGLIALMFWVYYLAWMIGWPEKMAYRMGILARGDQVANIWFGTLAALAISLAWIGIVGWRLSRQPAVLWKPALLASSGLVLIWFLFQMLFLDAHNTRNSYREMAAQAKAAMSELDPKHGIREANGKLGIGEKSTYAKSGPDDACMQPDQVRPSVQASLQWFAGIRFSDREDCPWRLIQDSGQAVSQTVPNVPGWDLHWVGSRRGENSERFRLYLRSSPLAPS